MYRGYIKLWRKSLESAAWADLDLWRTWCCCLMLASHRDTEVLLSKNGKAIKIMAGQFITGRDSFYGKMYPKKRKSNPHPVTVWRWIFALKLLGNLHIETHNKYSIITIINWDIYQQQDAQDAQQNVPRMFPKCSNDAHNQELIKNDKNRKEKKLECFPEWIDAEVWAAFQELRKKLKAPLTSRAIKNIIEELAKLKDQGQDPNAVLDQSITRGWRGVFPLRDQTKDNPPEFDWSKPDGFK